MSHADQRSLVRSTKHGRCMHTKLTCWRNPMRNSSHAESHTHTRSPLHWSGADGSREFAKPYSIITAGPSDLMTSPFIRGWFLAAEFTVSEFECALCALIMKGGYLREGWSHPSGLRRIGLRCGISYDLVVAAARQVSSLLSSAKPLPSELNTNRSGDSECGGSTID